MEINLVELAKEIVNNFDFQIGERIEFAPNEDLEDFISDYFSADLKDDELIDEDAFRELMEDLKPFIDVEISNRVKEIVMNMPIERTTLLETPVKDYDTYYEDTEDQDDTDS